MLLQNGRVEKRRIRYKGKILDAFGKYDAGDYAYWLASGISTEYDEKMVDDCIQLFCEENLSEQ